MASRSTIRMPYGGGVRAPELHDDSPETYYVHTPGEGRDPVDACGREGLLAAAIRDPTRSSSSSRSSTTARRGEVPEGEHVVRSAGARRARGPT
jgi:pyruvate/2-oxoglutarate/acetoin dehydrogenase E1 component